MKSPNAPSDEFQASSPGGTEDFASLLAAQGPVQSLELRVGDKVRAKVIHIAKEDVFCALSPTQEASISKTELQSTDGGLTVALGDTIEAYVVSTRHGIELSRKLGRDSVDADALIEAKSSRLPIEGTVTGVNKGGLEVALGAMRGFCPIGQADIVFVEEPQSFVGKTLQFLVREVKDNGRSVVLSRRALLEEARAEQAAKLMATLAVGQRVTGKVTRLANFGAFVDLGGLDGLIPVSELAYARVASPADVLKEGEEVTVEVLRIEPDAKRGGQPRIALSLKATLPDPFVARAADFAPGASLEGEVVRLESFGAFVELFPGVQGLVHVSELSDKRVRHPSDVVEIGQRVTVRVQSVDPAARRISLSLREARTEAHGESTGSAGPSVGAAVEGTVERIERYGVFVKLTQGGTALLPAAETGTAPGTDLSRAFPVGSTHALVVLAVDERGRIKVSKREREAAEERAVLEDFNKTQQGSGKGFGTFADLLRAKKRT